MMRITVTDDDGTVLDWMDITRDEWHDATANPAAALGILDALEVGAPAGDENDQNDDDA